METEVDVDNKDLSIAPGMYANTALELASVKNAVTIPVEALVMNQQKQETVFVLGPNNHIHIRAVQVGLQGSKLAQVLSGLEPGDRVLIGGQEKYHDDEEVNPMVASTPASETVEESGGMIDLKSGANGGGQ